MDLDEINRRTKRFTDPPEQFDPEFARADVLYEHGLPPRPDKDAYPDLHAFWLRLVRPPLKRIDVQFELYPQDDNSLRSGGLATHGRQQSSRNWSGVSITPRDGRMFTEIAGAWRVPEVSAPGDGHYRSSTWIGLDGQRSYLDATLPQIGTAQRLTSLGSVSIVETSSWVQWYPEIPEIRILGLGFAPEDEAAAYITVLPPESPTKPQRVFLFLTNLSALTSDGFHPYAPFEWLVPETRWPDPVTSPKLQPQIAGGTAQWVMERPTRVGSDELRQFPDYSEVVFEPCFALTATEPGEVGRQERITGPTMIRMTTSGRIPRQSVVVSRTERLGEEKFRTSPPPP